MHYYSVLLLLLLRRLASINQYSTEKRGGRFTQSTTTKQGFKSLQFFGKTNSPRIKATTGFALIINLLMRIQSIFLINATLMSLLLGVLNSARKHTLITRITSMFSRKIRRFREISVWRTSS